MTSYQPGDLVLVAFPFSQGGAGKQRPALVLVDTGDDDLLLARVTTKTHRSRFDVRIIDWQPAGLLAPPVVRLHKLATITKKLTGRQLGTLSEPDRKRVGATFTKLSGAW